MMSAGRRSHAVEVADLVHDVTVDAHLDVLALARVEAAQEDLLGVAFTPSLVSRKPGAQPSSSVAFLCGISVASFRLRRGYPARRRSGRSVAADDRGQLVVIVIVSPTGAWGSKCTGHVSGGSRRAVRPCAAGSNRHSRRSPRRVSNAGGLRNHAGSPASRRRRPRRAR